MPGSGPVASPGRGVRPAGDRLVGVLGAMVALAGGFVTAVLALLLVPLRLRDVATLALLLLGRDTPAGGVLTGGTIRVPVAIVVAIAGNLFLIWFARKATGVRWTVLLPAVGWLVVMVAALQTTRAGDRLLVPDDWVATLTLFSGTAVLTVGVVLALTRRPGAAGLR